MVARECCPSDGLVEGKGRTFDMEIILQSLDNILQEHAHDWGL